MTEEEKIGWDLIIQALRAPIKQIAVNSGVSGEEIMATLKSSTATGGYNFLTNEYVDLIDDGVIDPAKVVKCSLRNAASVASMLLTTEAAIYESEEDVVPATRTPKGRNE